MFTRFQEERRKNATNKSLTAAGMREADAKFAAGNLPALRERRYRPEDLGADRLDPERTPIGRSHGGTHGAGRPRHVTGDSDVAAVAPRS